MRLHGVITPIFGSFAVNLSAIVLAYLVLPFATIVSGLPQALTIDNLLADLPSQFALIADSLNAAVETALLQAAEFLTSQPNPELYWSYGRSPPVYPSRKSSDHSASTWRRNRVCVPLADPSI
jgi:hypothetical protein